jgi:hypothetical protein
MQLKIVPCILTLILDLLSSVGFYHRRLRPLLGPIVPNPDPSAGKIKRHPEVETLLVTRDNRAEVMTKVLRLGNRRGELGPSLFAAEH